MEQGPVWGSSAESLGGPEFHTAPVLEQLRGTLSRSCTGPVTFPGGKGQKEFSKAVCQVKWAKPYLHPIPKDEGQSKANPRFKRRDPRNSRSGCKMWSR